MAVAYADMPGVYTFGAGELDVILGQIGIRIDPVLNALAPYETTPNAVPTPITEWEGQYTLDTTAIVEEVLQAASPRGQEFFDLAETFKA